MLLKEIINERNNNAVNDKFSSVKIFHLSTNFLLTLHYKSNFECALDNINSPDVVYFEKNSDNMW